MYWDYTGNRSSIQNRRNSVKNGFELRGLHCISFSFSACNGNNIPSCNGSVYLVVFGDIGESFSSMSDFIPSTSDVILSQDVFLYFIKIIHNDEYFEDTTLLLG